MSGYYRKIIYFTGLNQFIQKSGIGFARVQGDGENATIQVGLNDLDSVWRGSYRIGTFVIDGENLMAHELGKEVLEHEEEWREFTAIGSWQGMIMVGEQGQIIVSDCDELIGKNADEIGKSLIWNGEEIRHEEIHNDESVCIAKEADDELFYKEEEGRVDAAEVVAVPDFLKTKKSTETKVKYDDSYYIKIVHWTDLFRKYDTVEPFAERDFYDCVEIGYKDLKYLPPECNEVLNNSFLLHGLYRYQHVLLGRYREKKNKYYLLGVPGIYSRSEKVLAPTFGFDHFKKAKRVGEHCQEFGYWYSLFSV